jgi:hypothetical protein
LKCELTIPLEYTAIYHNPIYVLPISVTVRIVAIIVLVITTFIADNLIFIFIYLILFFFFIQGNNPGKLVNAGNAVSKLPFPISPSGVVGINVKKRNRIFPAA